MKYRINGQEVTREKAHDAIRDAVGSAGIDFLENAIRNGRREELESVTLHIGTKKSIEVIFK